MLVHRVSCWHIILNTVNSWSFTCDVAKIHLSASHVCLSSACNNSRTSEGIIMKFDKICQHIPILDKIWQERWKIFMKTYMCFWVHLEQSAWLQMCIKTLIFHWYITLKHTYKKHKHSEKKTQNTTRSMIWFVFIIVRWQQRLVWDQRSQNESGKYYIILFIKF
jgi:hypothetical protein